MASFNINCAKSNYLELPKFRIGKYIYILYNYGNSLESGRNIQHVFVKILRTRRS